MTAIVSYVVLLLVLLFFLLHAGFGSGPKVLSFWGAVLIAFNAAVGLFVALLYAERPKAKQAEAASCETPLPKRPEPKPVATAPDPIHASDKESSSWDGFERNKPVFTEEQTQEILASFQHPAALLPQQPRPTHAKSEETVELFFPERFAPIVDPVSGLPVIKDRYQLRMAVKELGKQMPGDTREIRFVYARRKNRPAGLPDMIATGVITKSGTLRVLFEGNRRDFDFADAWKWTERPIAETRA